MSHSLALSNSSLASSSYLALSEEEQRKVLEQKREREARSLAVEKAYVHDVYEQISGKKSLQVTVRLVISRSATYCQPRASSRNLSGPVWHQIFSY